MYCFAFDLYVEYLDLSRHSNLNVLRIGIYFSITGIKISLVFNIKLFNHGKGDFRGKNVAILPKTFK